MPVTSVRYIKRIYKKLEVDFKIEMCICLFNFCSWFFYGFKIHQLRHPIVGTVHYFSGMDSLVAISFRVSLCEHKSYKHFSRVSSLGQVMRKTFYAEQQQM